MPTGAYHLPLFQGVPSRQILQVLGKGPCFKPLPCLHTACAACGCPACGATFLNGGIGLTWSPLAAALQEFADKGDVDGTVVAHLKVLATLHTLVMSYRLLMVHA